MLSYPLIDGGHVGSSITRGDLPESLLTEKEPVFWKA
jgi:hypothetical protein